MENNYYIYFHINLVSNEVFYVGKGKDKRAWSKSSRSPHWHNIVNKYGYRVDIIEKELTDVQSKIKEIYFIKKIGRKDLGFGKLVNHTDGGEGVCGLKHTEESKLKTSLKTKGDKNYMFGKTHTEEARKKISEKMSGENNHFYGKKRPDHSKLMSQNNPSSVKIKYNDIIYNSIMDLWRSEFSDINERAFRARINRGKIIFERIESFAK